MPDHRDPTLTQPLPTTPLPYAATGGGGRRPGAGVVPVPPPRPYRPRANPWPVLLVVLVVLAGLLVACDRLGVRVAERSAAHEITTQLGLDHAASVEITGIPFLTQLADSTFDHVVVDADDVPIDQATGPVPIDHLHLDLRSVHGSDGLQRFEIDRADGWAQLSWTAVSALGGVDVAFDGVDAAGQGRVRLVVSQDVFGSQVRAEIRATPQLDTATQTITFADPQVRLLNIDLPATIGDALVAAFLKPIPVAVPLGLSATGLVVTTDGVRLDLAGDHLTIGP